AALYTVAAEGHDRLRNVEVDVNLTSDALRLDIGYGREVAFGGERPERAVDEPAHRRGINVPHDTDLERVARPPPSMIVARVRCRDACHRFQSAAPRAPMGVIRKRRRPPRPAADVVRTGRLALEPRDELRADALDGRSVEPRRIDREPKQLEGFVLVLLEGTQRAANRFSAGIEAEFNGLALEALLEDLGVNIAGAFIERADHHLGRAALVLW